jgi:hypothetical protein
MTHSGHVLGVLEPEQIVKSGLKPCLISALAREHGAIGLPR